MGALFGTITKTDDMGAYNMEQKSISIGSQRDLKNALKFVNNNNLIAYTGYFTQLKIICNVKLKNQNLLVNYLFTNKQYYGAFKKILRSKYC